MSFPKWGFLFGTPMWIVGACHIIVMISVTQSLMPISVSQVERCFANLKAGLHCHWRRFLARVKSLSIRQNLHRNI